MVDMVDVVSFVLVGDFKPRPSKLRFSPHASQHQELRIEQAPIATKLGVPMISSLHKSIFIGM